MEKYPKQIQQSVKLLKEMQANSGKFRMWKNVELGREVLDLLGEIPDRGENHTPYDKIFLLCKLEENISSRDIPRFAMSVLSQMLLLYDIVKDSEIDRDDDGYIERGWIEKEYMKWSDYVDTDNVTNEAWIKKYRAHLKFDPVERSEVWERLYELVEAEVEKELGPDVRRGMGFCHHYWYVKRDVLSRYGIDWNTPALMNPGVMFD